MTTTTQAAMAAETLRALKPVLEALGGLRGLEPWGEFLEAVEAATESADRVEEAWGEFLEATESADRVEEAWGEFLEAVEAWGEFPEAVAALEAVVLAEADAYWLTGAHKRQEVQ